jgi:NifU-like protein
MDACHTRNSCCGDCSASTRIVCHCLQITEEMVVTALEAFDVQSVKDLRQFTGAGDGCTACHHRLRQLFEQAPALDQASSSSPI